MSASFDHNENISQKQVCTQSVHRSIFDKASSAEQIEISYETGQKKPIRPNSTTFWNDFFGCLPNPHSVENWKIVYYTHNELRMPVRVPIGTLLKTRVSEGLNKGLLSFNILSYLDSSVDYKINYIYFQNKNEYPTQLRHVGDDGSSVLLVLCDTIVESQIESSKNHDTSFAQKLRCLDASVDYKMN